jgi:hypothetical protein
MEDRTPLDQKLEEFLGGSPFRAPAWSDGFAISRRLEPL